MTDCVFCGILAGSEPASFVHESDEVVAFMDIAPVTPGHLLVIPREHHADLGDVPPAVAGEMMRVAQALADALRRTSVRVDGVNLFYADGEAAGQEVFHAHLHVFPRWPGDGFRLEPTYGQPPTRATLDEIAAMVRSS